MEICREMYRLGPLTTYRTQHSKDGHWPYSESGSYCHIHYLSPLHRIGDKCLIGEDPITITGIRPLTPEWSNGRAGTLLLNLKTMGMPDLWQSDPQPQRIGDKL